MKNISLTELADRFNSDKGMLRAPHHGYTFVYEMLFHSLRDKPVSILELGLARTTEDYRGRSEERDCALSPSVEMWLRYFEQAHVTGFDLSDFSQHRDSRFTFIQGDLGKEADYDRILEGQAGFDIVVDDGSHASFHQMLAFTKLFGAVREGGFYIVEDTWSQPSSIEKAFPVSHTISRLFREFLLLGYFPDTSPVPSAEFNRYLGQINNVLFVPYHNEQGGSDQLMVVHKRADSKFHHYRSRIRFYKDPPRGGDRPSLLENAALCPDNPYPRYHLAQLDVDSGNLSAAWEHIKAASALATGDPAVTLLRVRLLFDMGKCEEAVAAEPAYMRGPVASEVIGLGFSEYLMETGAHEAADRILQNLLATAPDSSRCHYLLGTLEEALKHWEKAEAYYLRAFEILPAKLMYLKAYARMARKRKIPGLAEYLLDKGAHFQEHPGFHVLLANVYLGYGMPHEALEQARLLLPDPGKAAWAKAFIAKHSGTAG